MWKIQVDNRVVAVSLSAMLMVTGIFIYSGFRPVQEIVIQPTISKHYYFSGIPLEAKAAYVYDLNSKKVLYARNADTPLPLASITKVMTGVVASEQGSAVVTIDSEAIATAGDSGLTEGERWDLEKLLSFTLMSSSNDGAAAVAEAFPSFVSMMNSKAQALGLNSLYFSNATGLDEEETDEVGGYGSAEDIAKLFEYSLKAHPELLEVTKYPSGAFSSETATHKAKNTNTILGSVPNVIASKTGYTLKAGGNLAIVFDRGLNEPVIAVVLGSSYDGRFSDIELLASSTFRTYNESQ